MRHQQAFRGIAGAVFLRLGIVGDGHCHANVARVVHIRVAIAIEVLDHRHSGLGTDALNQPLAAARNDHIHIFGHGDQAANSRTVRGGHQLHRVFGQASSGQCLVHQRGQRLIRFDGLAAAAQDAGIAALDAQAGRLDCHVGTAFKNHAKNTDWHAHLPHANATGLLLQAADGPDHIGHSRQLQAAFLQGINYLGRQTQTIDHWRTQTCVLGARNILRICRLQKITLLSEHIRQRMQSRVFLGCRRRRHAGSRLARTLPHDVHHLLHIFFVKKHKTALKSPATQPGRHRRPTHSPVCRACK